MNFFHYLGLFLIILIVISLIPLKIQLQYLRKNHDDELIIKVYIIKWLGIRLEFPIIKLEQYLLKPEVKVRTELEGINTDPFAIDHETISPPSLERIPRLLKIIYEKIKLYRPVLLYMLDKVSVKDIKWNTKLGLKDPALTAVLTGTIWSAKNLIFSKIEQHVKIPNKKPRFHVQPYFNQVLLSSDIYCIFVIRIGHIIITGYNFTMRTLFKRRKK